jgi:glycosyltransferase involved in cell wall biosynthesis
MKIAIITYGLNGGAGIAALRLHQAFLDSGNESVLLNKNTHKPENKIYATDVLKSGLIYKAKRWILERVYFKKFQQYFSKTDISFSLFSLPYGADSINDLQLLKDCDVINIHWVSGYFDINKFLEKNNKPVFFTLHDTNYFTAGCHYFNDCDGYMNFCSSCPVIEKENQSLLDKIYKSKLQSFAKKNHYIIGISEWMAKSARKSTLFKSLDVTNISNSFTPISSVSTTSYAQLKSKDKELKYALVIAQHLDDKRKGWQYIQEIIDGSDLPNLRWIVVGKGSNIKSEKCIVLGEVNSGEELAYIYRYADFLVHPAIQDNFPNTIVESLAYGTPVVAFNTSGVADLIQYNDNGYLADELSSESLLKTLNFMISNLHTFDRELISKKHTKLFSIENQSSEYIKYFQNKIQHDTK